MLAFIFDKQAQFSKFLNYNKVINISKPKIAEEFTSLADPFTPAYYRLLRSYRAFKNNKLYIWKFADVIAHSDAYRPDYDAAAFSSIYLSNTAK